MSSAARHNILMTLEGTNGNNHGITPVNPQFKRIRSTGTEVRTTKSLLKSAELKPNRMPGDSRHGTQTVAGGIPTEVLYDPTFMDMLEATLCGTWTTPAAATAQNDISASAVDNSFNDANGGFPVVVAGDMIHVTGFTEEHNNGIFRVVSRTANKIVVSDEVHFALITEVAGDLVKVQPMALLTAGVVRRSFSILRIFTDMAGSTKPYHLFKGCEFNELTLTIPAAGLLTAEFDVVGIEGSVNTTAPAGAVIGLPSTVKPMDSFAGAVFEGIGAESEALMVATEVKFTINNGITPKYVIGSDKSIMPHIGESTLGGSVQAFFEDSRLMDKFLNEKESAMVFAANDPAGNIFGFEFPRFLYTDGTPPVSGDGPIMLSLPMTMMEDGTTGTHIRIWAAAV